MNPSTYYVPEGETRKLEVAGILNPESGEEEAFAFVDGSALFLMCYVDEAKADGILLLKQFGASQLLLAGLTPATLDPGQVVEVTRYEDGGYKVKTGMDGLDDAM